MAIVTHAPARLVVRVSSPSSEWPSRPTSQSPATTARTSMAWADRTRTCTTGAVNRKGCMRRSEGGLHAQAIVRHVGIARLAAQHAHRVRVAVLGPAHASPALDHVRAGVAVVAGSAVGLVHARADAIFACRASGEGALPIDAGTGRAVRLVEDLDAPPPVVARAQEARRVAEGAGERVRVDAPDGRVTALGRTGIAVVARVEVDRSTDAAVVHAVIAGRAEGAVVAGRAVRRERAGDAAAGGWMADVGIAGDELVAAVAGTAAREGMDARTVAVAVVRGAAVPVVVARCCGGFGPDELAHAPVALVLLARLGGHASVVGVPRNLDVLALRSGGVGRIARVGGALLVIVAQERLHGDAADADAPRVAVIGLLGIG